MSGSALHEATAFLDGPVHYLEAPGPSGDEGGPPGPPVVCVHGLGGSHQNWSLLAPLLARRHRVLAPDLAGFGRTPPAGRGSRMRDHQRLLATFLDEVVDAPAVLVGNSMGGLVAMLEASARPERVVALVLIDPALPTPGMRLDRVVARNFALFALPGVGEWVLDRRGERLSAAEQVDQTFRLVFGDPGRVRPELRRDAEELARARAGEPHVTRAFLQSARSLLATLARRRAHRQRVARLAPPTLVIHGERDRLVHVTAAHQLIRLRPDWELAVLEGVGHVPQLEAPRTVASLVEDWLDRTVAVPTAAHER